MPIRMVLPRQVKRTKLPEPNKSDSSRRSMTSQLIRRRWNRPRMTMSILDRPTIRRLIRLKIHHTNHRCCHGYVGLPCAHEFEQTSLSAVWHDRCCHRASYPTNHRLHWSHRPTSRRLRWSHRWSHRPMNRRR